MFGFLADLSSPIMIKEGIVFLAVIAVGGYIWWAWAEKKWPFGK